jgi:hypothetical protein
VNASEGERGEESIDQISTYIPSRHVSTPPTKETQKETQKYPKRERERPFFHWKAAEPMKKEGGWNVVFFFSHWIGM